MPPDPHESDHLFSEIGRVTVRWAELEDVLADFIVCLLNDERTYTCIVATELGYQGLTNLLVSLYIARHGDDTDLASLRKLLAQADAVEQTRNQIVHSTWVSAGAPHVVTRIKSTAKRKRGYDTVVENYDLDRFRAVSDEIARVRSELAQFALYLIKQGKAFDK